MKQKTTGFLSTALVAAAVGAIYIINHNAYSETRTVIGNDVSDSAWETHVVERWEEDTGWKAVPTPYDKYYIVSRVDQSYQNGAPRDLESITEQPAKKIWGIKIQFRYPGNNFVTLFPPILKDPQTGEDALDPLTKERIGPALRLPGVTKKISVWVMSQGKDYILEGYVRDWKGDTHKLIFGSLNYIGWRPLVVTVPRSIPQQVGSYPKHKGLLFTKFVVRATPHTTTETAYLFFDQLKTLTNKFDVHFDGAQVNLEWGGKLSPMKGTGRIFPEADE